MLEPYQAVWCILTAVVYKTKKDLIKTLIRPTDTVLDVGFYGQGIQEGDENWPHKLLKTHASKVYGVDLELPDKYLDDPYYLKASAENFTFQESFDVIFAGDLIEHLSNPGLFLSSVHRHLKPGGRLILTTPNTFNLFNIAGKLANNEPATNSDHTFYFNSKVLKKLLEKNDMLVEEVSFLYDLGYTYKESSKKKLLNILYKLLSIFTDKFVETLVIVARAR